MAKILIIDDRPLNRQFLTTLLGYQHHDLREASDGAEGLRIAREQRPDLIISDVLMPTMDGYEFVRRLREESEIGETPVIFSTAHYLSRESQALAEKCGITSIISKPCEPEIVLRTVADALSGRIVAQPDVNTENFDREHLQLLTDQLSGKANALRAVNQKLTVLCTSSRELLLERHPPTLLNKYCEFARQLVGAKWAALALVGDEENSLGHFHAIGLAQEMSILLQSNLTTNPVLREVTQGQLPWRTNSHSSAGFPEAFCGLSSLLIVPLILQTRVAGWLCLADKLGASEFDDADHELLVTLAAHLAVAYENALLLKNSRQAEEEAREAEEKYRRFFEIAFVGIYETTPDGRFITANTALAHMKGYRTSAELISNNAEIKHPNYVDPRRYDEFKRLIEKQGEVRNFESEIYRRDHSVIWISENTRAVRDQSGKLLHYEGFIKDITDHKRAEEAVRSTPTVRLAGLGALLVLIMLRVSEHYLESVVSETIALAVWVILGALGAVGITYFAMKRQETLYRRTLEEIAERKRAEDVQAQLTAEIESQRHRLDNIVKSVPGVVWEAWGEPDAGSQQINFVSNYVETMLGYSVEEWVSTPQFWLSIVHPDDKEEAAKVAGASFATGRTNPQAFRWIAKDGRAIWVESTYTVIADDAGRPLGMRGVTMDITERKTLEDQLRQAQKMESMGTLAGGIAHDFNNILGAIIGYAELAQIQVGDAGLVQAHCDQILKASTRARDLVRQILTFSRQGADERAVLHLQPVIEETLKLLRSSLLSTVEIRQNIDVAAPAVYADASQMQQVIMNLCTNAAHAMKERGGVLEIALAGVTFDPRSAIFNSQLLEGPCLHLMIKDSGCGMSPVTQERIFDPFFTTKPPGEGTGLGLAVVHGVIKAHGGAISVESEPGAGTTMNIYLPVSGGQSGGVISKFVSVSRGQGQHILFVDDEPALVEVGKELLENLGYRVTTKSDGVEALAAFRLQPEAFDLVITDQNMPHINGLDLARELLLIRPALPVIIATGNAATISPEKAKALGVRELLAKPNTQQTLAEAISRALWNGTRKEI